MKKLYDVINLFEEELTKNFLLCGGSNPDVYLIERLNEILSIPAKDLEVFNNVFSNYFKDKPYTSIPLVNMVQYYNVYDNSHLQLAGYQMIALLANIYIEEYGEGLKDEEIESGVYYTDNYFIDDVFATFYITSPNGTIALTAAGHLNHTHPHGFISYLDGSIQSLADKYGVSVNDAKSFIALSTSIDYKSYEYADKGQNVWGLYGKIKYYYPASGRANISGNVRLLRDDMGTTKEVCDGEEVLVSHCDLIPSLVIIQNNKEKLNVIYGTGVSSLLDSVAYNGVSSLGNKAIFFPDVLGTDEYVATKISFDFSKVEHITSNMGRAKLPQKVVVL